MGVLFFANGTDETSHLLLAEIELVVKTTEIEIFRTTENLKSRLYRFIHNLEVAVLLASSRKELQYIVSIRDLFGDIRIILILPDRERDTISQGHKLYPRFLSYVDSNFADVAAVLAKMLKNMESKRVHPLNYRKEVKKYGKIS